MMTYDLFSTLYRLRHCRNVPRTVADLPDPAQRPALVAVRDALGKGEVLPAEHYFQALLALPAAELEHAVLDDSVRFLRELECWHGKATLTLLHEWALQCPMSIWPRVFEIMYWQARLMELRIAYAQAGRALPSEPWHDLSIVMHLVHLQSLSVLGLSALDWRVAQLLLSIELIADAPDWVEAWCEGNGPVTLPDRDLLLENASLRLEGLGIDMAWWPELPHHRPALFQRDDHDVQAMGMQLSSRWLFVGLKASPYGFCCLHQLAVSHLTWLPEVPAGLQKTLGALAQQRGLTDDDINEINSLFWQDEVYALIRQGSAQRTIVARIRDDLRHRPLSPAVRGNLVGMLMDCWERQDSSLRYIGVREWAQWQRYRCATMLLALPDDAINEKRLARLVELWVRQGKQAVWCRPLIEAKRHHSALAAVLYGAMCDNGWAGLERDVDKADAWYRYAVELAPPDGIQAFNATNCMSEPFSQALLLLSEQDGQETALWHMLCFAADAGYSDAQYRRGLFMSVAPGAFSIDDAEPWLLASLRDDHIDTFVAHYHLGILYAGQIKSVALEDIATTSETPLAYRSLYHFMAFLQLFLDHTEVPWRDEDYQQIERAMFHSVDVLCRHPELQPAFLQPLHRMLVNFRDDVRLTAGFTMLAYLYGREDSPMRHFDMAVRMIEGVRQLFPQIESIQVVHELLREQSENGQRRFDQIAAMATADDLPGCSTITPPAPLNPF
ncbi:hypothetical protein [Zymobacter sp. IVIA_5232.4 C2]|uniref:hypothetical protein n=1 Tax=Zymobacter sp. IVIA_5232.4 C2 TaxID=3394855 RepID=UPI0039C3F292